MIRLLIMMDKKYIQDQLKAAFPEAHVVVSGDDGAHFHAQIISSMFVGKSRLQQHKMVYQALGEQVGHDIHALSLTTQIPEEAQ